MRQFATFTLFCLLTYALVTALPADYDSPTYELKPIEESMSDSASVDFKSIRERRYICDLFSFEINGINFQDSACSIQCLITQGRRDGGSCQEDGVCNCK